MIVTIDGPAGSGKSSVARLLAGRLGLPYLNSGYIYRAGTVLGLDAGADFDDEAAVLSLIAQFDLRFEDDPGTDDPLRRTRVCAGGHDLTGRLKEPEVTDQVWRVANNGAYREALREIQRRCAEPDGVVAEGRDMGSVIFPAAQTKIFLETGVEERARRQYAEAVRVRQETTYAEVLASIRERDARDSGRQDSPLVVPEGASVVRTDGLSVDRVVEQILEEIGKSKAESVANRPPDR